MKLNNGKITSVTYPEFFTIYLSVRSTLYKKRKERFMHFGSKNGRKMALAMVMWPSMILGVTPETTSNPFALTGKFADWKPEERGDKPRGVTISMRDVISHQTCTKSQISEILENDVTRGNGHAPQITAKLPPNTLEAQEMATTQVSCARWTILFHFNTFWGQFKISHTFLYMTVSHTVAWAKRGSRSSHNQLKFRIFSKELLPVSVFYSFPDIVSDNSSALPARCMMVPLTAHDHTCPRKTRWRPGVVCFD